MKKIKLTKGENKLLQKSIRDSDHYSKERTARYKLHDILEEILLEKNIELEIK